MTGDTSDGARWDAVEEATELLLEGDLSGALVALKSVVEADAFNPYAYHYLGTALYELQRFAPARDAYQVAVKLAPKYLAAKVGLSHALRRLGAFEDAVVEADDALLDFPEDGDALFAAGLALAGLGRRERAKETLERFLKTNPELELQLEAKGLVDALGQGREGDPLIVDGVARAGSE